jgi:SPOR domain
MLIRALIVLLIALNLGAAAWWLTRTAPPPAAPPQTPPGAVRLQLLNEAAPANAAATPAVPPLEAAPPATEPAPAPVVAPALTAAESPPPQCFSLGPFADAAAANAAIAKLGAQATRVRSREQPGRSASGYNVTLPPAADRAAAQALAQRIGAAGFDDYLIVSSGEQSNGIALGRYRSRDSAERRQAALQAAGFPAQLQPIGEEGAAEWWLELAAAPDVAGAQLQTLAAATRFRALDCAALR